MVHLNSYSQSIKSISETYTHYETDSAYYSWGKETHRWEYDKKGKLIKDHHKEGVCFQDWTYDKKERLLKEESHCGEGFSICDVSFKKGIRISNCTTNYHTEIRRDSSDKNGRLIWKEHVLKYTEGDTATLAGRSEFSYDENGNCISEIQIDLKTKTPFLEYRRHYSSDSRLAYVLLIHFYAETWVVVDSVSYRYDAQGRKTLIEEFKYDFRSGKKKVELYRRARFSYADSETEPSIRKLNDTIIESAIYPYFNSFADFHHSSSPTVIDHEFLKRESDEFGGDQKHKYVFGYDSLGRIVSIEGGEQHYSGTNFGIKREIDYYEKGECVVNVFGKTYTDEIPVVLTYHYEDGRLLKIIEYSESGFPQYVRKYIYTFYK